MSNWQQKTLGDLISTMKNGSNASQNKSNNGIPITRIETISDEFINWKKVGYIKKISKSEFEKHKIRKGDILFSHINSKPHIGKTAIYSDDTNDLIHGINLLLIRANDRVTPNFLLYALRDKKISGYFASISSQSVNQASINQSQMKKVSFLIPSIDLQKQITQILSTLQNKVELVDKQIKLYEELKKSTMEKLFSEGLYGEKQKETKIGLIPESWEVKKFDNLCVLQRGKDLPKRDFIDGIIPVAGSNGVIGYHNKFTTEAIGVTVGRSGSVGKTNIYFTNFWAHNTVLYVKDFFENDRVFTYYYLDYLNLQKYSSGVSVPTLNRNVFSSILISIPPLKEQKEISDILEKIDQKIKKLTSKKKSYQQLFNSMLHKLMNQEIDVVEW